MRCPFCGKEDNRVIDSRPVEENNSIRRRRICDGCGRRFTTYEKVETIPLVVIKKDNGREPYDRAKIEGGILRACHKRPVSVNQIKRAVDEIESELFEREEKEITTREIGELTMEKIRALDPVAYVRFASVYREFKDVETFMDELENVLKRENSKRK
ncbi:MAG: transcriptional repressor NrdR [Lachnospiraceae bacterium]|nr:transcriptional repressor NrdR [Lachnospiraceae bacterium]